MNRRELDALRQRLAARGASEEGDPPGLLAVAAVLLAAIFILSMFI